MYCVCFGVMSSHSSLNCTAPNCKEGQEKTDVLVQEASNGQEQIYGSANEPLRTDDSKLAGEATIRNVSLG